MSKRMPKVNELLKREISNCLERDFEFPDILVTIHAVDVTPDLRDATVFVGVIGSDTQAQGAIRKLNRRRAFVQAKIMKRVVLKNTPRLEFRIDDSVERGVHLVDLLDSLGEIDLPDETDGKDTGANKT